MQGVKKTTYFFLVQISIAKLPEILKLFQVLEQLETSNDVAALNTCILKLLCCVMN